MGEDGMKDVLDRILSTTSGSSVGGRDEQMETLMSFLKHFMITEVRATEL